MHMKQSLIHLKDTLKGTGFKFEASTSLYNPMERFADYVSTKEIVHSKIIADLLNPKGEHQLGYGFLVMFLQTIGISVETKPTPSVENPLHEVNVKTESFAPTDDSNGRIDILVTFDYNGKRYAIIIENKLNDAPDQPRQLERYNEYLSKSGYNESERITVYMPRVGDKCDEYPTAKVINATMLAKIIDETLGESISPNKAAIQSYSNYLKNISINNIIMDNAKILGGLTAKDIKQAKAIKEAYDLLPQAFAEHLRNLYKEETEIKAEISADYSHYCYIWKEEAYRTTSLWLAVGFGYDWYRIYVVSNNEGKLKEYENNPTLQITREQTTKGKIWLRPQNDSVFEVKFDGIPNLEELQVFMKKWLEKLDEVAGIK